MSTNIVIYGMTKVAILKKLEVILGNTWHRKYMTYDTNIVTEYYLNHDILQQNLGTWNPIKEAPH